MNGNLVFALPAQSESVKLLHKPPASAFGPNFCVFLGGKKCWRKNDAQVSMAYSCAYKHILIVSQIAWHFGGEGYQ